ncbi:hypothetical protein F383_32428 [Gossypium arboreum]|uniref:Uncharacterized protein n=1 Tax=Gossypium arboreum TaxID=29729 RepID=A0A0B0N2H5_GOSAR|nr:hypothetical protein F383_32428 [Gossypium arboreum]
MILSIILYGIFTVIRPLRIFSLILDLFIVAYDL